MKEGLPRNHNIIVWLSNRDGEIHYSPFLCEAEHVGEVLERAFPLCLECSTFTRQIGGSLGIRIERGDHILDVYTKDLSLLP